MIKVGVLGAKGRMGRTVCETVEEAPDTELVARVDQDDPLDALLGCDVAVDFTHVAAVMDNLRWCVEHGVTVVVGTSGFGDDRLAEVRSWLAAAPDGRVLIAPNFSVGAVLMMRFAAQAARFFDSAEVIELHHANKMDAPSGTALRTASVIGEARGKAGLGAPPTRPGRNCQARAARSSTTCTSTRCGWQALSRTRRCCSAGTVRP